MPELPPAAVLTDIEGTTTPISFVRDILFPYARARLEQWVYKEEQAVVDLIDKVRRMVPGQEPLVTLLNWMDEDIKAPPLKELQGFIWTEGYRDGSLKGEIYPDVYPCIEQWCTAGIPIFIYSSGSVAAQKLLFENTCLGNMSGFINGYFDTNIGTKRDPESYNLISIAMQIPTPACLFLSDVEEELDAASKAGMQTCQLLRKEDGTIRSDRHTSAADFFCVGRVKNLP